MLTPLHYWIKADGSLDQVKPGTTRQDIEKRYHNDDNLGFASGLQLSADNTLLFALLQGPRAAVSVYAVRLSDGSLSLAHVTFLDKGQRPRAFLLVSHGNR